MSHDLYNDIIITMVALLGQTASYSDEQHELSHSRGHSISLHLFHKSWIPILHGATECKGVVGGEGGGGSGDGLGGQG